MSQTTSHSELTPDIRKFIRDWYPAENWGDKMTTLYKIVASEFKISIDEAERLVRIFDGREND